jgi:hypothetical protein
MLVGVSAFADPLQYAATGHYYEVVQVPEGIDWQSASDAAQAKGGHLATIGSYGENAFVFTLATLSPGYWTPGQGTTSVGPWLGGFQPDGSPEPSGNWQWVTGEAFTYTNWSSGEPNNSYHGGYENRLHYGPAVEWTWNDLYANDELAPHGYIVEYPSAPAPSPLPHTRQYVLGDIDGFNYEGAGSEDDVYVDPDWLAYVETVDPPDPEKGFDLLSVPWADPPYHDQNHNIPFTFLYDLAEGETITEAALTIAMRRTSSLVSTDSILVDNPPPGKNPFDELGWLPVSASDTTIRTLDLGNVLGDNYLPDLQDGQLNVLVRDDVGIDFAVLTLEVIPEPATLGLLAVGGLGMFFRRKRRFLSLLGGMGDCPTGS